MNTNFVFLHARWYNPSSGTFISRDPFGGYPTQPYSFHPYQYDYSSPLRNTDHSGRCIPSNKNNPGQHDLIWLIQVLFGEDDCFIIPPDQPKNWQDLGTYAASVGEGLLGIPDPNDPLTGLPVYGTGRDLGTGILCRDVNTFGRGLGRFIGDLGWISLAGAWRAESQSVRQGISSIDETLPSLTNSIPDGVQPTIKSTIPSLPDLSRYGYDQVIMFRVSRDYIIRYPGSMMEKANIFETLVKKIDSLTGGNWTAMRFTGQDGSQVFAGTARHSLVIDPQGQVWQTPRGDFRGVTLKTLDTADVNYSFLELKQP